MKRLIVAVIVCILGLPAASALTAAAPPAALLFVTLAPESSVPYSHLSINGQYLGRIERGRTARFTVTAGTPLNILAYRKRMHSGTTLTLRPNETRAVALALSADTESRPSAISGLLVLALADDAADSTVYLRVDGEYRGLLRSGQPRTLRLPNGGHTVMAYRLGRQRSWRIYVGPGFEQTLAVTLGAVNRAATY